MDNTEEISLREPGPDGAVTTRINPDVDQVPAKALPKFGDARLPDRFWSKCAANDADCWIWTGYTSRGYGRFNAGHVVFAHRHAYESLVGPIPTGLCIDHLCRAPACCNPAHLEPVTGRTNALRGVGPSAVNATKTHCPRGHEYNAENTYIQAPRPPRRGRGRVCKACMLVYCKEHKRRTRAAAKKAAV